MKNPLAAVVADPPSLKALIRASAAQKETASARIAQLRADQRKLLNAKFKQDRLAGKITLPYQVWLVRLFEIVDAGFPVEEALSRVRSYLEGNSHGMPVSGTTVLPGPHRPSHP
jgi:hypothetical protein